MIKYLEKFRKKNTQTSLISTEYCVVDENGNLRGTFQTLKEAQIMLDTNPNFIGYKFQTYKIETTSKL